MIILYQILTISNILYTTKKINIIIYLYNITNILNSSKNITLIIRCISNEEHVIYYNNTHSNELVITLNDNYQDIDDYHLLFDFKYITTL